MKYFYILLFSFTILACTYKKQNKLIPKKEFISLLIDLHIADAMTANYSVTQVWGPVDSSTVYGSVFKKYHCTREDFERTLEYYTNNPKKLTHIYDEVFSELSERSEEVRKLETAYSQQNLKEVYHLDTALTIKGDTSCIPFFIHVPVDSLGTYMITTYIRLSKSDQTKNPIFTAYFYNRNDSSASKRIYFKPLPVVKTDYPREYMIVQKLKDKSVNALCIIIPENQSPDSVVFRDISVNNLSVKRLIDEEPQ